MVVYNRRKRAIYFEDLEKEQAKILGTARSAVAAGSASPAQKALVEGIAEEEALMEKKKAERKLHSRMLWWLHGDWKEDKTLKEQRRAAVEDFKKAEIEEQKSLGITQAVQEARAGAAPTSTAGGPLDQAAANVEKAGKGWFGRWL
ncbi:hypothetical protein BS50DRAFT_569600 [Corynespora cassiicola Philippines]|uniref:Uncharacterized protein n=1 Tax=Corynespora cassiicola Philippines TaxID=1448308 RepID=A0A2T2P3V8_CORCC|nr:hypothetical protein BS50DRAFT_569600 [Corynespora cassiicola Philippines]